MLVPGVSGGSMAMILGIYDKLITAVGSFLKNKRANSMFLGLFLVGGILGMLLLSKPILGLITEYPRPMMYFFIGAVCGGVPMIYMKANVGRVSGKTIACILSGAAVVLLMSKVDVSVAQGDISSGTATYVILVAVGIIAAVALVLPGISISYVLLLMGMYDEFIRAVSQVYLPFLMPLGIGLLLGIILTTKVLEWTMAKYTQQTYLLILGFILGSVMDIFPGIVLRREMFICIITFLIGFGVIWMLSHKEAIGGLQNNGY